MADHANIAAAQTAGYKEIQTDRGASASPRYRVTLEKHVVGEAGSSGSQLRASAENDVLATAQAAALAGLNKQRAHRYGRAGMTDDRAAETARRGW